MDQHNHSRIADYAVQGRRPSGRLADARPPADMVRTLLLAPPVDIALAGPVPLGRRQGFLVPEEPGVYVIHDLRGVLYAGRTTRLRRRFGEHCEARGNDLIALAQRSPFGVIAFSWSVEPDRLRRAQLERALVQWLRPACNRVTPNAPA